MKFSLALIAGLLSATEVLAAPRTALRRAAHEKRLTGGRQTKPFTRANVTDDILNRPDTVQATEYSTNWAGAALVGSGYTSIKGTFTVPTVSVPSGGSSGTAYSASAWVGLDGYTCESAILQTGLDFTVQNGRVSYDAWYEWYPASAIDFSGISFSAGNTVALTITATSKTSGTATIENVSTGKTVTHTFSGQSASLCETNAEWIVEDFEEISGNTAQQVPFANFGKVTFTGASPSVSGADIVDMTSSNGNTVIASASTSGSSEVIVTYE